MHSRTLIKFSAQLLGLLFICFSANSFADNKRNLIVFGDSLSDPGNVFALTGLTSVPPYELIPDAPYAVGDNHFTNGKTWVEQLAKKLHSKSGPAFDHPRFENFAVGGARTRATGFMDLTTQVTQYLSVKRGKNNKKDLYVIMMASNDTRDAIEALSIDPTGATSLQILEETLLSLSDNIQVLIASGAENFIIANVPNLSLVPAIILAGPEAQAAAFSISSSYNSELENLLSQLHAALGAEFALLDIFQLLTDAASNPDSFGFSNVDSPCIIPGAIDITQCETPETYLFWDGIHPSVAGHAIITDLAEDLLTIEHQH